jgi:serine/threonine protein kinase
MTVGTVPSFKDELDSFVAAFEAEQARDGQAELTAFLPDAGHPLYRDVLRELVRVDLEYGWARGHTRSLEEYQRRFPQLFQDPEDFRAIAFEEYRQRWQAGENPVAEEYQRRFGIDTRDWPALQHLSGEGDRGPASRGADHLPEEPLAAGPAEAVGDVAATRSFLRQSAEDGPDDLDCLLARLLVNNEQGWLVRDIHRSDPQAARQLARALTGMPAAGSVFLGFHLIAELGRGAFGRVYLARQGELADRPVALKVSSDVLGESRSLAQLQHTNVVPIYSVHHAPPFHAVCMPFLGPTTLAHVLRDLPGQGPLPASGQALLSTLNACKSITRQREVAQPPSSPSDDTGPLAGQGQAAKASAVPPGVEPGASLKVLAGLTYVQAVVWIGARLADGLAHAHERGILHRDLKPANILLSDDGQPLLLDFNLSEDTKLRSSAPAAFIGGTLPYMAPEHLRAFQRRTRGVDARSDLYSLGAILYELLTRRQPFPLRRGLLEEVLSRMIQDRLAPPPKLRRWNPAVTPAVESIIRQCLEAEPDRRYPSARELQEDLERHLKDLPLRHAREPSPRERLGKWVRRHPRLTSATSIAVLAVALLLGLGGAFALRGERLARLEAAESFHQFREEMRETQVLFLDAATGKAPPQAIETVCQRALDRYHVLEDPSWQQAAAFRRLASENQEQLRRAPQPPLPRPPPGCAAPWS